MNPAIKPPKSLLRQVGRAIADYELIAAGDRVLLGVSGGKDSLSLLHVLLHMQRHAPIRFELGVISVDPMVEGFHIERLQPYVESLGVPFFLHQQPIMEQAKAHMRNDSYCAWCSRMKRGAMYAVARREGYGVLALAHHLDDLAETFMLSAFHGGLLRTMRPNYLNDDGDLRVIRPLVYVRERQTADYARTANFPVIRDSCPACFNMPTQRQAMKEMLAQQEGGNKQLFKSLLAAMRPLFTVSHIH